MLGDDGGGRSSKADSAEPLRSHQLLLGCEGCSGMDIGLTTLVAGAGAGFAELMGLDDDEEGSLEAAGARSGTL